MLEAKINGYALGYFEAWNLESLEAVMEAAEETFSPVILGFGCFQKDSGWLESGGLEHLAALSKVVAERSKVPTALLLNEAQNFRQALMGIRMGFNAIMLTTSHLSFENNIALTKKIVEFAHQVGVAVEAELGQLPDASGTNSHSQDASLTDPDMAAQFVQETNVDALAVSVGNIHVLTEGKAKIDSSRLKAIHARVSAPLVIHGGTGFPDEAVSEAIANGVVKFNVGTILKRSFFAGMTKITSQTNSRRASLALGSRKPEDALSEARQAVKVEIKRLMSIYGCYGRARPK